MPPRTRGAEACAMRNPCAVLVALSILLVPMAERASADQVVVDLLSPGTAMPVSFVGASADGSRAFFFTAEALVAGDGDSSIDLYERSGGATTLLWDRVQAGADEAKVPSFEGSSADGSRVFFKTPERLVSEDDDDSSDVYERSGGV